MFERRVDRALRDFVECDALRRFLVKPEHACDVPRDRLAFAVFVGCEVNVIGRLCCVFQRFDARFFVGGDFVCRRKAVVDVNTHLALRQIANVAERRKDVVIAA